MIKIRLEKWEKALVFQILEQSKEWYNQYNFNNIIVNDPPLYEKIIFLISDGKPELINYKSVYLRGTEKENDLNVSVLYFDSNYTRDEHYNKILNSFKLYSEELKKRENTESSNNIEDNVFEF